MMRSSNQPFIVQRPPLLSMGQLKRIEEAMLRILEEVGIAVLDKAVLEHLASRSFLVKEDRVRIQRKLAMEFLDAERTRNGNSFSESPQPVESSSSQIGVSVLRYPQHVHDVETDAIVPFTTERLIEATKLLDVLSLTGPPGCPVDVALPVQPVVQYWIGATYSGHAQGPVDPKSSETMPYIMEMAEVLGNPLRSLPVYVFSPLTLGGESLKCVLKFRERLSSVHVSDMASVGCTVPIHTGDALALSTAEVIGSAILLKEIIELPVHWSIRICPIDLRSMAMVLGSPEDFLLQLTLAEVNAYFHGTRWYPAAGSIHTNAKLPGAQACAEKSSLMTAGALLGARSFGAVGTLSLDEVFSAEQLLYDLEIKEHVGRLVEGIDGECDPERCLRDVIEGLGQKTFVGLESTLENYRDFYWHPKLFERRFLSAWQEQGSKTIRGRTHARIRKLLDQHEYELDRDLQRELDRVLDRAKVELAGK